MYEFIDGVVTRVPALVRGTSSGMSWKAIDLARGWAEVMRLSKVGGEFVRRKDGGLCLVESSGVLWLTAGVGETECLKVEWDEVMAFQATVQAGRMAALRIPRIADGGSGIGLGLSWFMFGSSIVETMWCETANFGDAIAVVDMFAALAGRSPRSEGTDGWVVNLSDGLEFVTMAAGPRRTDSPAVERLESKVREMRALGQDEEVVGAPLVVTIDGEGRETVVWHCSSSSALAAVRGAALSAGGTTRCVGWDLEGAAGEQRWTTVLPSVVERWVKLFKELADGGCCEEY